MNLVMMRMPRSIDDADREIVFVRCDTSAGQKEILRREEKGWSICGRLESNLPVAEIVRGVSYASVKRLEKIKDKIIEMEDEINGKG